jgi:predicted MFS family arabinose efflux permease
MSETIGAFGRRVTALALPTVAILLLSAGPFEMGILNGLEDLAFPLLGLLVGVWADRWRRRPIMIVANLGRMLAAGSIPLAYIFATLHMYVLYLVAFGTGLFTVFFDVSYQSYLPTLIDRSDLIEGNSKLETSQSGALVAGPPLAGVLIQLVGAAEAVAADAIAYLASAILIFSIKKYEPTKLERKHDFRAELKEGTQAVFGNPILRRIAACTATLNLGTGIFFAVFYIFLYEQLKLSPGTVGFIFGVGSVGFIIGAVSASRIAKKLGLGPTLALSMLVSGALLFAVPLALYGPPVPILIAVWILSNGFIPVYNINQISLRQAITSDRIQGRMNATMRTFVWGMLPIGSLVGGILGAHLGIIWTLIIGALVSTFATIWVSFAPIISLRVIPHAA